MSLRGAMRGGLLLIGVGLVAGGLAYHFYLQRDQLPELPVEDVGANRVAGEIQYVKGAPTVAFVEGGQPVELKQSATFYLGSVFKLNSGAFAQLKTHGNYMIAMDGDGEFQFKEARASAERTAHTA